MSTKVIKSSASKDDVSVTVRPFSATETEADLNFGSGRYMYFTERDLSRILSNLDALRNSVFLSRLQMKKMPTDVSNSFLRSV